MTKLDPKCYVPILKWKKGEQEALRHLEPVKKQLITPIIEVVDPVDPRKIVDDLDYCFQYPIFLDTFNVEQYDISLLKQITDEFTSRGRNSYPILYFDNLSDNFSIISSCANRIAIRIPVPECVDGPTYQEIIKEIKRVKLKNQSTYIDLILDLGVIDTSTASIYLHATISLLEDYLINEDFYDRIIIAVTSFPEDLQSVPKSGSEEYSRIDFSLFVKLISLNNLKNIRERMIYSDYGVTKFSDSDIDFSKLRYGILPKVRYTTDKTYWVLKGEKDIVTRVMIKSYVDLAKEISLSPKYYGETFSFGDLDIKERAFGLNKKGPGGNKDWVTISANHHIVVLIQQLSTLLGI
ncbi:hypothetical protein DEAC_c02440 [Desulfosporosinus acididurans]|uniref:Beta protein n=1 Tax=Desulfosporosinus acididurans TaxID=476652 RepID=A0A0J1FWZ6_9FIRM|nr:hypothetical protein [Desulfosporosinus acididurans]KLU67837.1 hypothetical protein DEAC_c02440 [Desulfosporosinus acididurans]